MMFTVFLPVHTNLRQSFCLFPRLLRQRFCLFTPLLKKSFCFFTPLLRPSFCLFTPQKTLHGNLKNGPPPTTTRTTLSSPSSVGCAADKKARVFFGRCIGDGEAEEEEREKKRREIHLSQWRRGRKEQKVQDRGVGFAQMKGKNKMHFRANRK